MTDLSDMWFDDALGGLEEIRLGIDVDRLRDLVPPTSPSKALNSLTYVYGEEYCKRLEEDILRLKDAIRCVLATTFLSSAIELEYFDLLYPAPPRVKYRDHFRHAAKVMAIGEQLLQTSELQFNIEDRGPLDLMTACREAMHATPQRSKWVQHYLDARYGLELQNLGEVFQECFVLLAWRMAALFHDSGRGLLAAMRFHEKADELRAPFTELATRRKLTPLRRQDREDSVSLSQIKEKQPSLFEYDQCEASVTAEMERGDLSHGTVSALYILSSLYRRWPSIADLRDMDTVISTRWATADLACNVAAEAVWAHDKEPNEDPIRCPISFLLSMSDELDEFGRHAFELVESPRGLRQRRIQFCDKVILSSDGGSGAAPKAVPFKATFQVDPARAKLLTWFKKRLFDSGKQSHLNRIRRKYKVAGMRFQSRESLQRRDRRAKIVLPATISVEVRESVLRSRCMLQDVSRRGLAVRLRGNTRLRKLVSESGAELEEAPAKIELMKPLEGNKYRGGVVHVTMERNAHRMPRIGVALSSPLDASSPLGMMMDEALCAAPDCCA